MDSTKNFLVQSEALRKYLQSDMEYTAALYKAWGLDKVPWYIRLVFWIKRLFRHRKTTLDQNFRRYYDPKNVVKTLGYGAMYDGDPKKIAERMGLSAEQADEVIEMYRQRYPEIAKATDALKDHVPDLQVGATILPFKHSIENLKRLNDQ
jgi:hypothetical protein